MKTQKWTEAENVALVAAYLQMLTLHNAGTPFSKAKIRRELLAGPLAGRSNGSVDFKLMNVSGCLEALNRMPLKGYAPARNYQRELMAEVCRQLGITPETNPPAPVGLSLSDQLRSARAVVQAVNRATNPPEDDRSEYRSPQGIASWWPKDGLWHIALPATDPGPNGLRNGGFIYTDAEFHTRAAAIAAITSFVSRL
jgi:hypothetical protein